MAAAAVRKAQATSPPRKVTVEAFKLEFAGWEFIADSFFALLAQFKSENIKKNGFSSCSAVKSRNEIGRNIKSTLS